MTKNQISLDKQDYEELISAVERGDKLFVELDKIGVNFRTAHQHAKKQELCEDALFAIVQFLLESNASWAAQDIIINLKGEIENIRAGRELSFLRSPKSENRPIRARQLETSYAYAAAAVRPRFITG